MCGRGRFEEGRATRSLERLVAAEKIYTEERKEKGGEGDSHIILYKMSLYIQANNTDSLTKNKLIQIHT
jgi:hypothetical protein